MIKRLLRRFLQCLVLQAFLNLVLGCLYGIRPFKQVTILQLGEFRIGEFVGGTDSYLRRLKLGLDHKPKGWYAAVVGRPCNEQLLRMFSSHVPVIQNKYLAFIINSPTLKRSPFVERLPWQRGQHQEFSLFQDSGPVLSFNEVEERQGRLLLEEMGIPSGAWFVCFHAKDPAHIRQILPQKDMSREDFKNVSVANYIEAMEYVASCDGYALRVGSVVDGQLPDLGNPRIIDYATKYRTDFGDIYLPARCKFFVGCSAGLFQVASSFNVPVVNTSAAPLARMPLLGRNDLFLPLRIYSAATDRPLTLKEMLQTEVCNFNSVAEFDEAGLVTSENSASEVLAVTMEMNERLDGCFVSAPEDKALQQHIDCLLQPRHQNYGMSAKIGAAYLRSHSELWG